MAYIWRKHVLELTGYPWKLLRLADHRVSAEVKASIRHDFASARECCLPAGFSRAMKKSGIDLQSENTLQFLYWYAHMINMTTADVEVRHARNNTSAGTSGNNDFGNIASQYIITEFAHLKRCMVVSHLGACNVSIRQLMMQRQQGLEGAHSNEIVPIAKAPAKRQKVSVSGRRRGETAVHIFAADNEFEFKEFRHRGRVTKTYWANVREAYAALPEDRKDYYQSKAQLSAIAAREQKRIDEQAEAAEAHMCEPLALADKGGPDGQPSLANAAMGGASSSGAIAVRAGSSAMELQILPMNICASEMRVQSGGGINAETLQAARQHIQPAIEMYTAGREDIIVSQLVNEQDFASFTTSSPVKSIADELHRSTRRLGASAPGFQFPKDVKYPHHCRAMCERLGEVHQFGLALMAVFDYSARQCGSPAKVPMADMLLVADIITEPKGDYARSYWLMVAAAFRSGHHVPTQTFMRLEDRAMRASGAAFEGKRLNIERDCLVNMTTQHSALKEQSAAPVWYSEEGAARCILMEGTADLSLDCILKDVTVRKLKFEEQVGGELEVLGLDTAFPEQSAEKALQKIKKAAAKVAAKAKAKAKPIAGPDFFAFLDDMPDTTPRARAPTAAIDSGKAGEGAARPAAPAMGDFDVDLGQGDSIIREDPWADAAFMDGLREAIGDDSVKVVEALMLDLAEDEEEQRAMSEKQAAEATAAETATDAAPPNSDAPPRPSAPASSAGSSAAPVSSAAAPASSSAAPAGPAGAVEMEGALGIQGKTTMFGLDVQFTGFTSGIIAKAWAPNPSGSSSSSAPAAKVKPAGVMHKMNELGLKMTCGVHNSCSCWITARDAPMERVCQDLMAWVADAAIGEGVTENKHYNQSQRLKANYGMRVKTGTS